MALVIDAGPLFASIDRGDASHQVCRQLISNTRERLIIPSPVLVEVDQLTSSRNVPIGFQNLLADIAAGIFAVENLLEEDYERIQEVIRQYADADIGFVDAAVLAIVERLGETKLATLDRRHFGLLRPRHVDSLRLVPE